MTHYLTCFHESANNTTKKGAPAPESPPSHAITGAHRDHKKDVVILQTPKKCTTQCYDDAPNLLCTPKRSIQR